VHQGNRIHQRQGFLRVVRVRIDPTHSERYAPPVANQMARAPALGPIGGIRTGLVTAVRRADATAVYDRATNQEVLRDLRAFVVNVISYLCVSGL
jgi:hypothetical protein